MNDRKGSVESVVSKVDDEGYVYVLYHIRFSPVYKSHKMNYAKQHNTPCRV
jgi:hypothetical protein